LPALPACNNIGMGTASHGLCVLLVFKHSVLLQATMDSLTDSVGCPCNARMAAYRNTGIRVVAQHLLKKIYSHRIHAVTEILM
jgi:hypothetical protein